MKITKLNVTQQFTLHFGILFSLIFIKKKKKKKKNRKKQFKIHSNCTCIRVFLKLDSILVLSLLVTAAQIATIER